MKIMKRSLSVLLSMLMIVSLFAIVPLTAYADDSNAKKIYTVNDLKAINNDLSGNYILMNDIDLSSINDWKPIGDSINYLYNKAQTGATEVESRNYFSGTLEGNGYSIIGLSFAPFTTTDITENESQYLISYGLFSHISGGEVKNLSFKNINISFDNIQKGTDNSYTTYKKKIIYGALSGSAKNATISNIDILSGSVLDSNNSVSSGGLVSFDLGDSIYTQITNYLSGDINGGILYSSDKKTTTIKDCLNYGTVDCGIAVGGDIKLINCTNYAKVNTIGIVRRIYAYSGDDIYIDNCSNYGDISRKTNSVSMHCGGLFDEIFSLSANSVHIKKCVNKGNIDVLYINDSEGGYISSVGGIIGKLEINGDYEGEISNLVNCGKITVTFDNCKVSKSVDVGGIIGYNNSSSKNTKYDRLFNYGSIETNSVSCAFVGGLISSSSRISISNSVNFGNINLNSTESETSTSTIICIGGVVYSVETGDLSCVGNEGDITINGDTINVICGGITSNFYAASTTTGYPTKIMNAYNSGKVTVNDSNTLESDSYKVGGISGVLLGTTTDERLLNNICCSGSISLYGQPSIKGKEYVGNIFGINPKGVSIGTSDVNVLGDCYVALSDAETNVDINVVNNPLSKESYIGLFDTNDIWTLDNGKYPTLVLSPNILFGTTGDCEWLFNKETNELTVLGQGAMADYNSEDQPWYSFNNQIESVSICNGVTYIGQASFKDCKNLKHVTIPESITRIGNTAFCACETLSSIIIPDSVLSFGNGVFSGCVNLTNVVLPNSLKSIGKNVFGDCNNLESIVIPESINEIPEYTFRSCTSLKSVKLPNTLTSIGENGFRECSSLEYIDLPTNITNIGKYAFWNCNQLKDIEIPKNVSQIGEGAFVLCKNLTDIIIPNSLTSIEKGEFEYCEKLSSIVIPTSVISIKEYAFYGCNGLKDVYYEGTQKEWNDIYIDDQNNCLTNATIHFPDNEIPSCSITTTNDLASSQTITLSFSDNVGIAGYYWGTESNYINNTYSNVSPSESNVNLGIPDFSSTGTYYLTAKDTSGNVSETQSITFYKTTLNANGGTLASGTPSYVLTASGNSFTPNNPTRSNHKFTGWNISRTATTGSSTITPASSATYYAIWEIINNEPTTPSSETKPTSPSSSETNPTSPTEPTQPSSETDPSSEATEPTAAKTTVTASIDDSKIYVGETAQITATVKNGVGTTTFKSSNTKVATVSSNGLVTGIGEGTATITVTNNGVSASVSVYVSLPTTSPTEAAKTTVKVTIADEKIYVGKTTTVSAIITNGYGATTYKSNNTKVATVNSNGTVTGKGAGKAIITVTNNGVKDSVTVTVMSNAPKKQTITAKSYTKTYGAKAFSLGAKTSGNGKLTYASSNKKVVTISSKGKVTIKGCGKATITIKASATSKYKAATKKITITVKPGKIKLLSKKIITSGNTFIVTQRYTPQKNCDGYKVQIAFDSNFIDHRENEYKKTRKDFILNNLPRGRKIYVRIRAYKKIGKSKVYGKWSKTSYKA